MKNQTEGLVSILKAAEILNCTPERVHELCNTGFLNRIFINDFTYVREMDLYELFKLNIVDPIKIGKLVSKVISLEAEIERLKTAINLLYEVNNFRASKFNSYTASELLNYYLNIKKFLEYKQLKIKDIYIICGFLLKLTDIELLKLRGETKEPILKTLYLLITRIHKGILGHPKFNTKLDLQQLHSLIVSAKKNLNNLILTSLYIEEDNKEIKEIFRRFSIEDLESFDLLAKKILAKNAET
jgi:hypothetical protein